jgi:hypothetical protein
MAEQQEAVRFENFGTPAGCNIPEIFSRPSIELIFCIVYFIICTIFLCAGYFFYSKSNNGQHKNRLFIEQQSENKQILQRMLPIKPNSDLP